MNPDPLHLLHIGLEDRPGAVHAVAEVFSGRGLQMEALHGSAGALCPDGLAVALILFRAQPERAGLIARVLRRLSMVRSVELLAGDDPRLLCFCLVAAAAAAPAPGLAFLPLPDGLFLAYGRAAAVVAWREHAQILSPLRPEILPETGGSSPRDKGSKS